MSANTNKELSDVNYRIFDLICDRIEVLVASGLTVEEAQSAVIDSLTLGYYSNYYLDVVKQSIKS